VNPITLPTWFLHLAEHHVLVRSVQRLPGLHPTLEGALLAVAVLTRMALLQVFKQGRRIQARLALQTTDDLLLPDPCKRVRARSPVPLLALRYAHLPVLDPPCTALGYARLGTRLRLRATLLSVAHVKLDLFVGDPLA
jgi:hypothetical protein